MEFALWAFIVGALLIGMALVGSQLRRLPVSTGILYLAVGAGLGPDGLELLEPEPLAHARLLERAAEAAVLISLFAIGLKLGLPMSDQRWRPALRLASVSMVVTVALIGVFGHFALGLPLGAAVLLGAVLAPTDPVLASDVQVRARDDRDRLRFSLSAEGGLNDGAAFPFVMLGLGLLGLHDLGPGGLRWVAVDVLWAVAAGLVIGAACGAGVGRLVVHLRTRHRLSIGRDEFLALGLVALAYGLALLAHAYGFLAVLAAGVALQRVQKADLAELAHAAPPELATRAPASGLATHERYAGAWMMREVQQFNEQLERIAELAVVLLAGAMLAHIELELRSLGLVAVLLLVVRPVAVWIGLLGTDVPGDQRRLISWFGIRGIGSIYYLMYAVNHGLPQTLAETLVTLTLTVVAASILVHGISVTPLMQRYARSKGRGTEPPRESR
jgi:NhaP-type Na+/H+ or K+/H+ antiporter